jgi:hypothetical protein
MIAVKRAFSAATLKAPAQSIVFLILEKVNNQTCESILARRKSS